MAGAATAGVGSGPVAGLAEGVAVVEASDGSGLGEATVADEGVGGVDEGVAGEAEAGGVRLAVDEATLGTTQLAQRLQGRPNRIPPQNLGRGEHAGRK